MIAYSLPNNVFLFSIFSENKDDLQTYDKNKPNKNLQLLPHGETDVG